MPNDSNSIDLFPGSKRVVEYERRPDPVMQPAQGFPASKFPWTQTNKPFRVHYYNGKKVGTWHAYFDTYLAARDFAQGRRIYAQPCIVERQP